MLTFLKGKSKDQAEASSTSMFDRLKSGLQRTRSKLSDGLVDLLAGHKSIDQDLLDDIEAQLLTADVGITATKAILAELTEHVSRDQLADPQALAQTLKVILTHQLKQVQQPLVINTDGHKPYVILMIGINGAGKTTTIGKLAKRLQAQGRSVMLAAGDTFRAAAVEQLEVWGDRNDIPVISQGCGADSASVIYDAMTSAKARGIDVLIADTAGRLHTQAHLMAELEKVHRVMKKVDPNAPQEVMLVLDAGIGQNALAQTKEFHASVPLSGITLTKLDGTAKGGIIFAIAKETGLPIRFIGFGEHIDDLRPFDASTFVEALF